MGQGKGCGELREIRSGHGISRQANFVKLAALAAAGLIGCFQSSFSSPSAPTTTRAPGLDQVAQTQTATDAGQFDKMLSWQLLVKQVDFGPRKPGTAAHRACRDYLKGLLEQNCDKVWLQPFSHVWSTNGETIPMWNIIGVQNWEKSDVRVALLAHWDTRPTADQEADPAKRLLPIPGADDGASGVAVLVELARALKVSPAKVGVMYVLLDGEDLGPGLDEMFLGAKAMAADLPKPKPDYGILLDMIGNRGVVVPREPNSDHYAPNLESNLYSFARRIGLGATFANVTGPEIEDDHLPLNEAGLPTIDLIDFSYPSWHTLADTPDKCSPDSLGKIGLLLQEWLRQSEPYKIK
jgi:glutaminyl-peptide cyclotransferase